MKNIYALILVLLIGSFTVAAQTRMGYLREGQGSFAHTSYRSGSNKLGGTSLDFRINYSLLGTLIFRNSDGKFMIGDHIGCGFGMGYFKKTGDDFPLMMNLNLEFGVKSTFALNDNVDIGVKYILGAGNYFTDLKNDFSLSQTPSIIPSVRFKKIMGSVGVGKGKAGSGSVAEKGKFIMLEGRYLFSGDDDLAGFLFLRFENYSMKSTTDDYDRKGSSIYLGIGFM
jgi:hypothetical protein